MRISDRCQTGTHAGSIRFTKMKTHFSSESLSPLGEGGAKRRVRVRMPKLFVVRPHPALRATFSRREKDPPRQFVYYFGQLCVIDRPYRKSHRHRL